MDTTAMTKLIAKKVKEAVSAMTGKTKPFKKGFAEGFTKDSSEKSKVPFSQKDMQQLYTPAQWEHKLVNVKGRVHPIKNPELYNTDCFPTGQDGLKCDGSKSACIWCRLTGHTIDKCARFGKGRGQQ